MTDKELRKLSRLELLELLLKEGRENTKLQEELNKLKSENSIATTAEHMRETADLLDESLQNIGELAVIMKKLVYGENSVPSTNSEQTDKEKSESSSLHKKKNVSEDADIYRRIMQFYAHNTDHLSYLPPELCEDVTKRLTEILTKE